MIKSNTIVNAINSIKESDIDVELKYSFISHELGLKFFKTSNYNTIVSNMDGIYSDPDKKVSAAKVGALCSRFKQQANGTFFSIGETESLAIKDFLERMGCVVDFSKGSFSY